MAEKLIPPKNGVTIRMYRPGHGDCFLLALPGEMEDKPVYILIDCGRKPGSQNFVHGEEDISPPEFDRIAEDIATATGGQLDLVVITHEHQDHVNGFGDFDNPYFDGIAIKKCWLAWTENPKDDDANKLREKNKDQLLLLAEARRQLALAVGEGDEKVQWLNNFMALEYGGDDEQFNLDEFVAAVNDPSRSKNKQAMKLITDKAVDGIKYLSPVDKPQEISGSAGYRAFVLGPPRKIELLQEEDPGEGEGFPEEESDTRSLTFAAAVNAANEACTTPFDDRYRIPANRAYRFPFFRAHYGKKEETNKEDGAKIDDHAPWRRINGDWLNAAETLALSLNKGTNNTSLVLAFELPKTKKILLFVGDAQVGNWKSWCDYEWDSDGDGQKVTARDILKRTVLYKVGHHGSHNATLNGSMEDDYPNLSWMGTDEFKEAFTAMITAVNKWALGVKPNPWRHPLPSIKRALLEKTQGRVFQTDTRVLVKPVDVPEGDWATFISQCAFEDLYFDYTVLDE